MRNGVREVKYNSQGLGVEGCGFACQQQGSLVAKTEEVKVLSSVVVPG